MNNLVHVGLMAEVDIDTEPLSWMGDTCFALGFLRSSVRVHSPCCHHSIDLTAPLFHGRPAAPFSPR